MRSSTKLGFKFLECSRLTLLAIKPGANRSILRHPQISAICCARALTLSPLTIQINQKSPRATIIDAPSFDFLRHINFLPSRDDAGSPRGLRTKSLHLSAINHRKSSLLRLLECIPRFSAPEEPKTKTCAFEGTPKKRGHVPASFCARAIGLASRSIEDLGDARLMLGGCY